MMGKLKPLPASRTLSLFKGRKNEVIARTFDSKFKQKQEYQLTAQPYTAHHNEM